MEIYERPLLAHKQCDPLQNGEVATWLWLHREYNACIAIDVGACNASTLIDHLTKAEQDACRFDLVEPNPSHYNTLNTVYRDRSNVTIHCVAADISSDGTVPYYATSESILWRKSVPREINATSIQVGHDRLDNLVQHVVDFIKIDVEGYELNVLLGAPALLTSAKYIQFEYGGTYIDANITLETVVNYLRTCGFEHFYTIEKDGLNHTTSFPEDYEYKNYLASRVDFSYTQ